MVVLRWFWGKGSRDRKREKRRKITVMEKGEVLQIARLFEKSSMV
jgi:hypothetical protein